MRGCWKGLAALTLVACATSGCGQTDEERGPDPQRDLTGKEAERLVEQVTILLDQRETFDARDSAARALGGDITHKAAFPALRAVIQNEKEDATLRLDALFAMFSTGLAEPLGDAVRLLRSEDAGVRMNAHEILCSQYRDGLVKFRYYYKNSLAENEAAINKWEDWWAANKDTFKLDRDAVFMR